MSDLNSIINSLKKNQESKITEFELPCSGIKVKLKPFQAKHNSMVNSSVVAGNDGTYTLKFSNLIKEIFDDLLEIEEGKSYKDIPLVDTHYLVLKVRETFSREVVLNVVSEDEEERVDIGQFIEKFEQAKIDKDCEIDVIEGDITVVVRQPSLMDNIQYDKILIASHKKFKENDSERLIKDALAYTLLKFIKSITIKHENEFQTIPMSSLNPAERREVLNNIPNPMYKSIMNAVNNITSPIEELLKVDEEKSLIIDQTLLMDV